MAFIAGRVPSSTQADLRGTMDTIRRQLAIDTPPSATKASWEHFLHWVHTSQHRLACDELACTDAVGTGAVRFVEGEGGSTQVIVEVRSDGSPPADVLSRQVMHDLLVFKDWTERRRGEKPLAGERRSRLRDDVRRNEPAHLHTSKENHNAPAGGSYTDRYPT